MQTIFEEFTSVQTIKGDVDSSQQQKSGDVCTVASTELRRSSFLLFKFSNKWFDELKFSFMKENSVQKCIRYHQETEMWYGNLCNNWKIVAEPLLYARGRIALWVVTVLARPFKNLIGLVGHYRVEITTTRLSRDPNWLVNMFPAILDGTPNL